MIKENKNLLFGIIVIFTSAILVGGTMTQHTTASAQEETIPAYYKDAALWWAEGTYSDRDFLQSIEGMITTGYIQVANAQDVDVSMLDDLWIAVNDLRIQIEDIDDVTEQNTADLAKLEQDVGGLEGSPASTGASGIPGEEGETGPSGVPDDEGLEGSTESVPGGDKGATGVWLTSYIETAKHSIPPGQSQGKEAICNFPYTVTGGGYRYVTAIHHVADSMPLPDLTGWKVWIKNNSDSKPLNVEVYAICVTQN